MRRRRPVPWCVWVLAAAMTISLASCANLWTNRYLTEMCDGLTAAFAGFQVTDAAAFRNGINTTANVSEPAFEDNADNPEALDRMAEIQTAASVLRQHVGKAPNQIWTPLSPTDQQQVNAGLATCG